MPDAIDAFFATLTDAERTQLRDVAREQCWREGNLFWKLHEDQKTVYRLVMENPEGRFVLEIARQWGKTFLLCVIAIETCLRFPGCRVVYGAPTLKHLSEFIMPTLEAVIRDAPADCRPVFNVSSGHWNFPNGSWIHLFGADDKRKANRGRGPKAKVGIFDEAGFTPILEYVIDEVFNPSFTHTSGRLLLGSTPAEEPDHDFTAIAERAEVHGNYARRTIHDNPLLTAARIQAIIATNARNKGLSVEAYITTDGWRREYLAERVVDKQLLVVPEWEAARSKLLVRVPRPEFFDGMSMLDFGGADPHAATFGYWDFKRAKWVIEAELLLREGQNTKGLADQVKAKELALWGTDKFDGTLRGACRTQDQELLANIPDWMVAIIDKDAPLQPWTRWADNNLALVRDLYELHGLAFIPTAKDDKQLQVNNFRVMVSAGEVLIDPSCVHTDRHLRSTTWQDHKRRTYKRRAGEHGDLVDTLVYGARNIDRRRNPYPATWDVGPGQRLSSQEQRKREGNDLTRVLLGNSPLARKLMGVKRRR